MTSAIIATQITTTSITFIDIFRTIYTSISRGTETRIATDYIITSAVIRADMSAIRTFVYIYITSVTGKISIVAHTNVRTNSLFTCAGITKTRDVTFFKILTAIPTGISSIT
jgi:hypothetical protein